jgi:23S rRNA pseudouridine1911/1915/1917 synthase
MMPERFEAPVGRRLDAVVAERLAIPRAEAQRAIAAGHVRVDGRRRGKAFRLQGGEPIDVDLDPVRAVPAETEPVPIRYRDDYLAVVSKPAGVPTHPTAGRRTGTLVNRLLGMGVPLAPSDDPLRSGIVHRLDAGTSGLLVVALDEESRVRLSTMFRRHQVDRRYTALVRGRVEHDRFVVDAPLGRRGSRVRVRAIAGRAAITEVLVRDRFTKATLVEAWPRTGRTHQIRVHLAAVAHPILGDRRYGGAGTDADELGLSRPFLHASWIGLDHPITGLRVELEEPLPPDLSSALDRLRSEA